MLTRLVLPIMLAIAATQVAMAQYDYRVLATNKTSTMEKEMNDAAGAGYGFKAVMGGETGFGGNEVVVVMVKDASNASRKEYRLLATNRTGTMQREIQEAGDQGFEYIGQTVFKSTFGGEEVSAILERDLDAPQKRYEYKLLATSRTSTMEKELQEAGETGFEFLGMTVGKTAMGGKEVVCFLRKRVE